MFWEADPTGGSHSSLVAGETVMWLVQGGVDDTQLSVEAFLYLRHSEWNSVLILTSPSATDPLSIGGAFYFSGFRSSLYCR